MKQTELASSIDRVSALGERSRLALYRFVAARDNPVTRDEAASGTGMSRELAAFHLDKLVDVGLLEAGFERRTGRAGPGAGRPAKVYQRSHREVRVRLPPRDYEFAAHVMADALDAAAGRVGDVALGGTAKAHGIRAGTEARAAASREAGSREAILAALAARGFEPRADDAGVIRLGNCPFHALAQSHRDLVCGMNHAFLEGFLEGLGGGDWRADLAPWPGHCCVAFSPEEDA